MGRKQIALNRLFNFSVVAGVFLTCCSIAFFTENDIAWGLGLGVTALLIIVIPAIFTPYCYIFDNEGVSLCYVFLPCERYLWNDVYAIEVSRTHLDEIARIEREIRSEARGWLMSLTEKAKQQDLEIKTK